MSEFKRIKGEWIFLDDGTYCEVQAENPLISICAINRDAEGYEFNGKLISCAPEMLEMLNLLTTIYSADNIEKAKLLIRKATD